MIYDNETNIVYLSAWLAKDHPLFFSQFTQLMDKERIPYQLLPYTQDIWCRDYMPIQVGEHRFIQYQYKPNYLLKEESDKQYITNPDPVCRELGYKVVHTDIVLDGGNVVKAGDKIIMTEKIFIENPSYQPHQLVTTLEKLFCSELLLLPWDKKESYGHADGIVKAIERNNLLITNYTDYDKKIGDEIERRLSKIFTIHSLNYNVSKPDKRNWCYINYLEVEDLIIIPALGIEEDHQALEQIERHFPNRRVAQLRAEEIVKKGGALNCITWCCKVAPAQNPP